jgi:hypothetical protein
MFKHLWICAALAVLGTGPLNAQQAQQAATLQKVDVPGADFHFVLNMTESETGRTVDLRGQPVPWTVYPIGDALAFATDDEVRKLFKDIGSSPFSIHAFQVERRDGRSLKAVSVYVVPNSETLVSAAK